MDFSTRTSQPQSAAPSAHVSAPTVSAGGRKNGKGGSKWLRIAVVLAVVAVVILLVGVIFAVMTAGNDDESKYVDTGKLQAVFLNTGQVYFGNLKTVNNKYFVLDNIYYLQTSSTGTSTTATASNTSVSLVKLGCELHAPYDQMVINRGQITFWENLQDNGQVAKAVATFEKQNPNGQKCSDQSSANTTGTSNVQGTSSTGSSSTTGTSTTTKP